MATKVLTAPLAIIKVNGIAVGKMRNLRISESMRRGRVVSIGNITPDEVPALEWSGTLSCSSYLIDFKRALVPGSLNRYGTINEFVDSLLLQESGIQLDIYRRIKTTDKPDDQFPNVDPDPELGISRAITGKLTDKPYASIKGAFINRESFDISEGQIAGRDAEFDYITPILYPL